MKKKIFLLLIAAVFMVSCSLDLGKENIIQCGELHFYDSKQQIALVENGAYYMDRDKNANWIIKYIDFYNKTDIPLCGRAECTHDDESCTAFIRYKGSMYDIRIVNDKLMLLSTTAEEEWIKRYGDEAISRIQLIDLNGENRKTLISLNAGQSLKGTMVYDDKYIYTMINETVKNDEIITSTSLVAININTGEKSEIIKFDKENPNIIGIYDNKIIIAYDKFEQIDTQYSYKTQIEAVDINEKETTHIITIMPQESLVVKNNMFYLMDRDSGLYEINLLDGKRNSIYKMDKDAPKMFILENIVDEYAIFYEFDLTSDTMVIYKVNLKTNERTEFSLRLNTTAAIYRKNEPAISILDKIDNRYLVRNGYTDEIMEVPLPNGEKGNSYIISKYNYAFIEEDALWKNIANYDKIIRINDLTE